MTYNKSWLFIVFFLLVALLATPTQGTAINAHIESYGIIEYRSNNSKLMGVDHFWWGEMNEGHFELVKNAGGNAWREHFRYSAWRDDQPLAYDPTVTFRSRMRQMMRWANERNIKIIIGTIWWESLSPPEGWSQLKANIIMNANGLGDEWIDGWGEIIRELQPYAIDVMNEPMWVYDTTYEAIMTQEQFFEAYRNFCIRTIRAWRAIKPDLICIVGGCPFWDLKPLAANPIPEPNLIYALHYYYSYDGTQPPEYSKTGKAYWEGRLDEAKTLLESELLNQGVKACEDARLQLLMEETGTCPEAPNAFVFMQDMYDFCKAHNIGVTHHALVPYPKLTAGLLNEDWVTLNDLGELWYQNMWA